MKCRKCGCPLVPEQMLCECGTMNAAEATNVGITSSALRAELLAVPGVNLGDLKLGSAEQVRMGREYKPVFAVGGEGQEPLRVPFGIARLPDGTYYVIHFFTPQGQARVVRFDARGEAWRVVREFGIGPARDMLQTPAALACDPDGRFYITDIGTCKVKLFSRDGDLLAEWGEEGIAQNQLNRPQGLALDSNRNLWIADTGNNRVLKWSAEGEPLMGLGISAREPEADWLMAGDGEGEFDEPFGVDTDRAGNLWVADTNNHRVQKFSLTGEWLLAFGQYGSGAGDFYLPRVVRCGADGNVYVIDANGERIQKFDSEGHFIYQLKLPCADAAAQDMEVDEQGLLVLVMRDSNLILAVEV